VTGTVNGFSPSSAGLTFFDFGTGFQSYTLSATTEQVPGPLPILGAAAAFGYSRKLRNRINQSKQQSNLA